MSAERPLRVCVVTPLGRGGRGGIDRMMDEARERLETREPRDISCRFIASRGQGSRWLSPLHVARVVGALALSRLGRRFDVAHINLSSRGSARRKILIAAAARWLRIPYLIHLHGSEFRAYWDAASPGTSRRIRAMMAGAARVVVLGNGWRDYIVARVPERGARVVVLANATRAAARPARAPGGDIVILFLGRLCARKGVPQLVAALSRLPRDSAWRAVLAGDGDVAATRREVARLGLGDRVAIPGWADAAATRELLETSDMLALPSLAENLPMSVIEGMAHGLAVVTTPVGATADIIADGVTGCLVAPGDIEALAQALARLLASASSRERLGAAARFYKSEQLEIGGYVERLIALWRDVASEGAKL
jgi:glycosyltransferase involved in cell wall biosynthesis